MKKIHFLLITSILLFALIGVGQVYAQDEESGYMVVAEAPSEVPEEPNLICDGTRGHPVLTGLASSFNVDYGILLSYFCDLEMGVGEIALALKTVQRLEGDVTLEELLALRNDGLLGWGEIWQSLGMIGNGYAGQNINRLQALVRRTVGNTNQIQNKNRPDSPPGLSGDQPGPPEPPPGQGGNKP